MAFGVKMMQMVLAFISAFVRWAGASALLDTYQSPHRETTTVFMGAM